MKIERVFSSISVLETWRCSLGRVEPTMKASVGKSVPVWLVWERAREEGTRGSSPMIEQEPGVTSGEGGVGVDIFLLIINSERGGHGLVMVR